MPLPWKRSKSKSNRISRFVSDFQQSPKHGGSLVVETGFPTSLIDLFVKNRNRLKKQPSKRIPIPIPNQIPSPSSNHPPPRRRVSSPPPASSSSVSASPDPRPSSLSSYLPRYRSLPVNLDKEEEPIKISTTTTTSKIEEIVDVEERNDEGGDRVRGGGGCVLMVVAIKVFMVAILALSTKKLAVGITLSAFTLLFLEFAVARVFTLLNICPNAAEIRIDCLIGKLIAKRTKTKSNQEIVEPESESTSTSTSRQNRVTFEITEEPVSETKVSETEMTKPVMEEEEKEQEVVTVKDVVLKNEKSKSSKLKSRIVKKIVPKKLRSYKKKRKMRKGKEEEIEIIGGELEDDEEEEGTEASSLYSESEVSDERDDISSKSTLLESCEEQGEEKEEEEKKIVQGDLRKVIGLIVIVLAGLLIGKVLAIGLTLSCCLILKLFFCCNKSRTCV